MKGSGAIVRKDGKHFVEKWNSVYFFMLIFNIPVKMPSLEEFSARLSKQFGRVEAMAKEAQMPNKAGELLGFVQWEHNPKHEGGRANMPSQLIFFREMT